MMYFWSAVVIAVLSASVYTTRHAISKIIAPRKWLTKDGFEAHQTQRKNLYDAIYKHEPRNIRCAD